MITLQLILAMIIVESAGIDHAIGDDGKAFGCLQIHAACVEDVNRIYGTNYSHEDMFIRKNAVAVCRMYIDHYVTHERLGHVPTYEDMARCWNAGPTGSKQGRGQRYWVKVVLELDKKL